MSIITNDARAGILYRRWGFPSAGKAAFILVHGLGGHSGRWEFMADFFLKHEICSYAIELKGFGETDYPKGHIDSFTTYVKDISALCEIAKRENPGKKIFLIGESMGALASFLAVMSRETVCDGLIAISPAFGNKMKFPVLDQIKVMACAIFNPKAIVKVPFNSLMCTRDPGYRKVMDTNPKEYRFASAGLLVNILFAQIKSGQDAPKLSPALPVLFLIAGNDVMVDTEATKKIYKELKIGDKTIVEYPQMYHALSIDLDRERVFNDILAWVGQRIKNSGENK